MIIKTFAKKTPEEPKDLSLIISVCSACQCNSGGKICMHCGENLYPKRITMAQIMHDIPDVFLDVDRGLFYTMRNFLIRPGREIKRYFAGDRSRHYKPLKYVLFIGGLATLIYSTYKFTNGNPQSGFEEFGTKWNSLLLLLQLPVIAFTTWLLFKKQQYTFGEHLIANAYIIAEVSLFNIALFPLYYILDGSPAIAFAHGLYLLFILFYYSFAFYDWFYERKGMSGIILSFVLVFLLMVVVAVFTMISQLLLYYSFAKLGWL